MSHTISETINGTDHEFEVIFEPVGYGREIVHVSEDGKKAVVGYLSTDSDPINPREEYDQVGTMVCWHRNYKLGDEQPTKSGSEWLESLAVDCDAKLEARLDRLVDKYDKSPHNVNYGSQAWRAHWDEFDQEKGKLIWAVLEKHYVILPLYLYDHSGITMSTGSFSCPWDSGQVGWIYCSREKALHEWGGKVFTKKVREKAEAYLKSEVNTYDQYLTGEVYGCCIQLFENVAKEMCMECGGAGCDACAYEGNVTDAGNPEWEEYSGSDGLSREECWGYFGDEYAVEELEGTVNSYTAWLAEPLPVPEEAAQYKLFAEGAGI